MASQTRLILPDGRTFDLHGSCTVGRSASNMVAITDNSISRKHALIQIQKDGECWMVDLGSSNGTYVNGRRISRPLPLKNGDLIDMAGSRIEFQTEVLNPGNDSGTPTHRDVKKRNCWLLVADIVGSTQMALELPPEEVPQVTGKWFNTCRDLVEEQGGHMNQYLGDGYFCYWEDTFNAKSQVLAAMRELARLQESDSLSFRFVLHFGETVLSNVPNTSELNLHGKEVNFVFRMEKLAANWGDIRLCSLVAWESLGVKSHTLRESEVAGYSGVFAFHVPDLQG